MNLHNSVKGQKKTQMVQKSAKSKTNFQKVPKIKPKRANLRINSLLQQNSVKFGSNFTQDRKHLTWILFSCLYVFASLPRRNVWSQPTDIWSNELKFKKNHNNGWKKLTKSAQAYVLKKLYIPLSNFWKCAQGAASVDAEIYCNMHWFLRGLQTI